MRKIRILSAVFAVLLLLPFATSCSKSVKEPKGHNMGAWTVESEPTYKKKGKLVRHCTDEGCSYSQSYKTKSTKVNYEVTEDGKIYVSGKKSSKTSFVYIDSVTPEGKKVDGLADFAFFDDTTIRYAYIEDGITEIGSYTFAGCSNLVEAHLPASCELFDFCHFLACTSLKLVNLPENMTSLPDQIFEGCESLEEVVLPSGLKSIGHRYFEYDKSRKPLFFLLQSLLLNFLCRPAFIAYDHRHANAFGLRFVRAFFKVPTIAWTVRSAEDEAIARKNGFDGIIFENYLP